MGQGMLGQLRKEPELPVEHGPHAVGNMLLMRPMDRDAFPAVAVIPAGLQAGAMIPPGVFLPELGDEFLLKRKPLRPVSPVKGGHRFHFLFVVIDFQRPHLAAGPAMAAVSRKTVITCPDMRCGQPRC